MYVDKEEAVELVRHALLPPERTSGSRCGYQGCLSHPAGPPARIRVFASAKPAEWGLAEAVAAIREAVRCAWVNHVLGHDLGLLMADGSAYYLKVPRPGRTPNETEQQQEEAAT